MLAVEFLMVGQYRDSEPLSVSTLIETGPDADDERDFP